MSRLIWEAATGPVLGWHPEVQLFAGLQETFRFALAQHADPARAQVARMTK